MTIGERIRMYRKAGNLTQKQLGELSGTSETTIKQYENGKREPRISQIRKISAALHCDITDLLSISDVAPKLKKEYGKKMTVSPLQKYLESLGYIVLREEQQITVKKKYIDFELSNEEKQMVEKYGYVMRNTFSYFIEKNDCFYRLSEKQFTDIEKEVISHIEFQLWKYRTGKNVIPEYLHAEHLKELKPDEPPPEPDDSGTPE